MALGRLLSVGEVVRNPSPLHAQVGPQDHVPTPRTLVCPLNQLRITLINMLLQGLVQIQSLCSTVFLSGPWQGSGLEQADKEKLLKVGVTLLGGILFYHKFIPALSSGLTLEFIFFSNLY